MIDEQQHRQAVEALIEEIRDYMFMAIRELEDSQAYGFPETMEVIDTILDDFQRDTRRQQDRLPAPEVTSHLVVAVSADGQSVTAAIVPSHKQP